MYIVYTIFAKLIRKSTIKFHRLFAPKVVEQVEETKQCKTELIIRESQPIELPPDVIRGELRKSVSSFGTRLRRTEIII